MIQGIKHIIFDLGGVLLDIDYFATDKAFEALGIADFKNFYSQMNQTPLFDDLETGRISGEDFVLAMQQFTSPQLTEAQVLEAWNAMLLNFPLRRLQVLQQLGLHYDLVLLSNTNEIHERRFNEILMREHGIPTIGVFFDKIYYSHRVGLRKPDAAVFQRILDDTGFDPAKTLFIDDSPQHIATARTLGIQTIFLEKGMTIEKDIFLSKN